MSPVNSEGDQAQNPRQSDLRKLWFRARISTLDNVEIATGNLTPELRGVLGQFQPDFEFQPPRPLNTTSYPEVLADLGTHQVRLRGWTFCQESANYCHPVHRPVHFDFVWPEHDLVRELLLLPMPIQAILFHGALRVATGEANLRGLNASNSFQSTTGDIPHTFPQTGGTMRLEETPLSLRLIDFLPCPGANDLKQRGHFHFRFEIASSD
jgi:hypothetical protein